jgi:hypothetical protein
VSGLSELPQNSGDLMIYFTAAAGLGAHAEGVMTTTNSTFGAHSEGYGSHAEGDAAHAEGGLT